MKYLELRDGTVTLPRRDPQSHKGNYGKLLIIGGSIGYSGAPNLCARAAVRSGAGLVWLGVPEKIWQVCAIKNDEAMPFPLPDDGQGRLAHEAVDEVLARAAGSSVCVVGPGLGKCDAVKELVLRLLASYDKPLVLDADALNVISDDPSVLRGAAGDVILTPHDGEFLRLGGVIGYDRAESALNFSRDYGCVTVLKGHRTMVAFPDGEVFAATHGNAGMAKGGSGDVLAGMIGGMLGQFPLKEALAYAVYLHGYAGDLCSGDLGEYGMTATDLIEYLPLVTKMIQE